MPDSQYDSVYRLSIRLRVSVPEVIRRAVERELRDGPDISAT